ncbi:hypothetical protein [Nocardia fluminea]|uniref:hypothetical protein n=1 Tax=Nocardia fluminea TaxID=134984 RepID=UPI0033F97531
MTLETALITTYAQTPEIGRTSRRALARELIALLESTELLSLQLAFSALVT